MYINKELRNKHIARETLSTDKQLVLSLPASLPGYVVLSIGVVSPLRVSGSSSRMQLFVFVLLSCLVLPVTPWAGCHSDRDKDHRTRENCTTRDFTDVPAGFAPTTKVFLFPKNQFSSLSWSTFQIFTKIYELDLTGNKIPEVTPSVAAILPSLSVLRLGSNRLTALSEASFSACPGLTELYLDHNAVDSLRDHTFSGLSKLEILDLSSNRIKVLPELLLHPLPAIETLYLENNKITVMPDGWFSQKKSVPYLYLSANPWACYCSLSYLSVYVDEYEFNVYVRDGPVIEISAESVVCESPQWLKNKPVMSLDETDLCPPESGPTEDFSKLIHQTDTPTTISPEPYAGSWSGVRGDGSLFESHLLAPHPTVGPRTERPAKMKPTVTSTTPKRWVVAMTVATEATTTEATTTEATTTEATTTEATAPNKATATEATATEATTTEATTTEATTTEATTTEATTTEATTTEATTTEATAPNKATATEATATEVATNKATTANKATTTTEVATNKATANKATTTTEVATNKATANKETTAKPTAVRGVGAFCFWLFAGCLLLCAASAVCVLATLARAVVWYRRAYKPLCATLARRRGGGEVVRMLTHNRKEEREVAGGGVVALYRSVLFVHREGEGATEKGGEEGKERLLVTLEPTGGGGREEEGERGRTGEKGVYRKTLYRLSSKEEELEGWRDVCRVSTDEGGRRRGEETSGGVVTRKCYSVILREKREEAGGGREELDWVVGGWEVKGGEEGPRSSWGEWLAHYLPSMPWSVTTPPENEASQ
ncbi:uncharacterized protein PEZ65_022371 [Lycodopsis pacificus]